MKNKTVKALAIAMTVATVTMMGSASIYASDDTAEAATEETADTEEDADAADTEEASDDDKAAADKVAALIDKIYVQERNDTTDEDCKAAKEAWDKLTDAQKALVEGEEASPEYFGADTGDASKDDPRNQDEIGENELLVVSFGTSFNDSRAQDIKGIEDKLQEAYPDWSVNSSIRSSISLNTDCPGFFGALITEMLISGALSTTQKSYRSVTCCSAFFNLFCCGLTRSMVTSMFAVKSPRFAVIISSPA